MTTASVACFVSPHGFGHAARACALLSAIHGHAPDLRFEIFTRVPAWFFETSLPFPFGYHDLLTDVGMAQRSALREDLAETVRRLDRFYPISEARIERVSRTLDDRRCSVVLCDIAPMGVAAARRSGIPSVLVENFTWDWIYEGYGGAEPGLQRHVPHLRELFGSAGHHIRTDPVCGSWPADLTVPPMARRPRLPAAEVREALGIPPGKRFVLVTMGGVAGEYPFLQSLKTYRDLVFVIPGAVPETVREENLILLPRHSPFFHPDLIAACDAVVGKVGYSTLAEAYRSGTPFGYLARPRFPESGPLVRFVKERMAAVPFGVESPSPAVWEEGLPRLLSLDRRPPGEPNGAEAAARYIIEILA